MNIINRKGMIEDRSFFIDRSPGINDFYTFNLSEFMIVFLVVKPLGVYKRDLENSTTEYVTFPQVMSLTSNR